MRGLVASALPRSIRVRTPLRTNADRRLSMVGLVIVVGVYIHQPRRGQTTAELEDWVELLKTTERPIVLVAGFHRSIATEDNPSRDLTANRRRRERHSADRGGSGVGAAIYRHGLLRLHVFRGSVERSSHTGSRLAHPQQQTQIRIVLSADDECSRIVAHGLRRNGNGCRGNDPGGVRADRYAGRKPPLVARLASVKEYRPAVRLRVGGGGCGVGAAGLPPQADNPNTSTVSARRMAVSHKNLTTASTAGNLD